MELSGKGCNFTFKLETTPTALDTRILTNVERHDKGILSLASTVSRAKGKFYILWDIFFRAGFSARVLSWKRVGVLAGALAGVGRMNISVCCRASSWASSCVISI